MKMDRTELRVRYKETDQMGVVYYSNYLVWFEVARTDFFRNKGLSYNKLEKEDKIYLPVVEANCRYKSPIRYDDVVIVETTLKEMFGKKITFEYIVKVEGKIKTKGYTKHVFVDKTGSPINIPEKILKAFSSY